MLIRFWMFILALTIFAGCEPQALTGKPGSLNWRAPNSYEETKAKLTYTAELQVADRSYVESVLLQVFDAAGTSAATYIQSEIYQKIEFGGACDYYASSDTNATTVEFPRENCVNGISVVQPATNNPMRYSLTTKVCERLVADSARMNSVRNKLFSNKQWAPPTDDSIGKAWSLFFPAESIDPRVLGDFKHLAQVSGGTESAWKNIILTLCISPEWQAL